MGPNSNWSTCQVACWLVAGAIGLVVFLLTLGEVTFLAALMVGGALAFFLGLVLTRLFCAAEAAGHPAGLSGGAVTTPEEAAAVAAARADPAAEEGQDASTEDADTASGAEPEAPEGDGGAAETVSGDTAVKPGTILAGEQDLASRKGEWRYQASSGAGSALAGATPDYDQNGVREDTEEGRRPEALDGPRGDKADNLKEIRGIGPKLEQMLNEMGFYHFDQIAGWSADEEAWVNASLKGFRGRVTRDNWIDQAKILAAGGETEFSKRVEDGGVY